MLIDMNPVWNNLSLKMHFSGCLSTKIIEK